MGDVTDSCARLVGGADPREGVRRLARCPRKVGSAKMTGSLMTMPMLIVNMGAEMIYVLDQRLKAQNIPRDKSSKVLEDIVKTMHNETFMAELFKPHRMYSNVSTRQIFDRLAHSSIMRLNANSMDKLYDLMRMGFKYQVLSCASADELLQVTMNHLANTKNLVDSADVKRQVDETIQLTADSFGSMSPADFYMLKQFLCRFFQDTRIKVSLFLQNGIQGMDGTLAIHYEGFTATGGKVPGTIRYFDASDRVKEEETFAIGSAEGSVEAPEGSVLERGQLNAHLGFNMYEADSKDGTEGFSRSTRQLFADSKLRGTAKGLDTTKRQKTFKATAADGLNLLADLVGTSSSAKDVEGDNKALRINLFPDDPTKPGSGGDEEEDSEVPTIWIDATSDRKTSTDAILRDFKMDDDGAKREGKGGDDLLDLMDSTG
ncbi:Protein oscp1 [Phytophthora pseudosyringae]|uniref:Protein oscp1 n=1 Tax=Phytophthora pseudosyringae TaxID=221518 RepID=A0A8T1WLZ6_9STRA|nr:Protein oscp1 [Phytophthora pseudosyringae]